MNLAENIRNQYTASIRKNTYKKIFMDNRSRILDGIDFPELDEDFLNEVNKTMVQFISSDVNVSECLDLEFKLIELDRLIRELINRKSGKTALKNFVQRYNIIDCIFFLVKNS
jgi:hypothetical protein